MHQPTGHGYPRQSPLRVLAALLLAAGGLRAGEPAVQVGNTDFCLVDKTTALPNAMVKENDLRRVQPFVQALPDGCRVRVEFATFGAGGDNRPIRYVCLLTPLNPENQIDGVELAFSDWYQAPVRQSPFRKGVKDGTEKLGTPTGVPQAEVPWVAGQLHGVKKTYHPNGKLATEAAYEKNVIAGETRAYSPEGQLLRVTPFKKGKRDGDMIDYWPGRDQVVERVVPYRNGQVEGLSKGFYADGKVKWERPFHKNEMHGIERQYAPDGKIERERHWLNGEAVSADQFKATFKE